MVSAKGKGCFREKWREEQPGKNGVGDIQEGEFQFKKRAGKIMFCWSDIRQRPC